MNRETTTPTLKDQKGLSEIGAEHLSAPVFVPKTPMTEAPSPRYVLQFFRWVEEEHDNGMEAFYEMRLSQVCPRLAYLPLLSRSNGQPCRLLACLTPRAQSA
jgi:hypothetical protein